MRRILSKITGRVYYSLASIKNRYPCRLVKIDQNISSNQNSQVTYQAINKINIRTEDIQEIISDAVLLEKFHPTDCVKMGFISCGDILFNNCSDIEELKALYKKIAKEMLSNIQEG